MARLAANISMLFTELPFLDRYAAAADAGFAGVECHFPYDFPPEVVARAREASGVEQVLFNLSPGDWSAGERGLAVLAGREAEFADSVSQALEYAEALECERLHVMAGILPDGADPTASFNRYKANLSLASERIGAAGRMALIEPINTKIDMPGYALSSLSAAATIQDAVGNPALRLQCDVYHMAVMGELGQNLVRRFHNRIAHYQVADFPGRNEPGTGELPIEMFFSWLNEFRYDGWVGCEYYPSGDTRDGLRWAAAHLEKPA